MINFSTKYKRKKEQQEAKICVLIFKSNYFVPFSTQEAQKSPQEIRAEDSMKETAGKF